MSDDIRRIRQMIDEGRVTPEEGQALIASVADAPKTQPLPPVLPTPAPAAPTIRASWIVWPLVGHGICLLAIYAVLVIYVPKFIEIFKDFSVALPVMTMIVIAASRIAQHWALLVLPASLVALTLDVTLYAVMRRGGWHVAAALWWWFVTLFALSISAIIFVSIFLPYVALVHQLGAGH